MFKLAWKGALAHKARLSLMALAIISGVAFVVGTYVFTDTMKDAFDVLFEQETTVDVVVRAEVDFGVDVGRIPEGIVDDIIAVPGVAVVEPTIQGWAQPVDKEGNPIGGMGPPNLAFNYTPASEDLSAVTIREGRPPAAAGEVLIDVFTAENNGFTVGDTIEILLLTGSEQFEIVGTAGFGDADNLLGATLAMFETRTAQRVLGFEGEFTQVAVEAAEGVDAEQLRQEITAILPADTEAILAEVQIEEGKEQVEQGIGFFSTLLLAFAGIGIFVGAFLIQNTYRIVVAQRTKELAMLRAVGATGRQVTWMVIIESLLVALVVSAIGILAGVGLAVLIRMLMDAAGLGFPQGSLTILPRTIIIGLAVGVIVTMASAILPARKASKVPPVAALRDIESTFVKSLRMRLWAGLAVLGVGAALVLYGLFGNPSSALAITGIGAGIGFLGVSVLAPLIAVPFGKIVGAPLPKLYGVTGRLAQGNAVRKPRRMAATASALMIGVALVTVVATIAASAKTSIEATVRDEVIAEYQIQVGGFVDPFSTGLSPELTDELLALPEVEAAPTYRLGEWREPGSEAGSGAGPGSAMPGTDFLIGIDTDMDEVVRLGISAGNFDDLARLNTVMLDDGWAESEELVVGDTLSIETPTTGVRDLEVVAIFGSDLFQTNVVVSMDTFEANYNYRLNQMVMIKLADGVDAETIRPALDAIVAEHPNADLNNAEEYVDVVAGQLDLVLNVMTALLAMAIIIALLGIANTLALSIMERKREIGLLRAVGMQRRQVRRMIRWESVLIAVFGGGIGLLVGVVLGLAVVSAIGSGISVTIPWANLIIYLALAGLGGILAAIVPAYRGAKTDLLEAIAYE